MDGAEFERGIERIRQASMAGLDLVGFWRECTAVLARAVPHYLSPCWYTCDPATLLITSHYQEGMLEIPGEWLAEEYYQDDYNKVADVARSRRGVATLHEATGGHPERSYRFINHMVPHGAFQESLTALRTRTGETWGVLGLYRDKDADLFDEREKQFLAATAPLLSEGARRALLMAEAREPDGDQPPGLIVLDRSWEIVSLTAHARMWLDDLPPPLHGRDLPPAVYSVAGAAKARGASRESPGTFARVRGGSGCWIELTASEMAGGGSGEVAVIISAADRPRIAPLLMAAYGLTQREQELVRLVLAGSSTDQIASQLTIAVTTVQQHLKSVFEKTGVNSRRDLVGKLFFAHYEPRVRDNERRAAVSRAIRGGPKGNAVEGRRLPA